jgi:hypothetical protein
MVRSEHPDAQGLAFRLVDFTAGMLLTAILHLYFKQDCLRDGGYRAPTDQELIRDLPDADETVSISSDVTLPTHEPLIARFMDAANQKLALFWKVPKHWLATLADYLHRPFTPQIVQILNQRAMACYYDT